MFTITEKCDMLEMWHLSMRNENKARSLYEQKYSERRIPNDRTFRRVGNQLRQKGVVANKTTAYNRTDEEKETNVLLSFIENRYT
ncbi:hypothetical protein P5V15_007028 [Pogonomyrmex californicus]